MHAFSGRTLCTPKCKHVPQVKLWFTTSGWILTSTEEFYLLNGAVLLPLSLCCLKNHFWRGGGGTFERIMECCIGGGGQWEERKQLKLSLPLHVSRSIFHLGKSLLGSCSCLSTFGFKNLELLSGALNLPQSSEAAVKKAPSSLQCHTEGSKEAPK